MNDFCLQWSIVAELIGEQLPKNSKRKFSWQGKRIDPKPEDDLTLIFGTKEHVELNLVNDKSRIDLPPDLNVFVHPQPSNNNVIKNGRILGLAKSLPRPPSQHDKNYMKAVEEHPESLLIGDTQMLYVQMSVNGVSILGFVDCGAQATVMTEECAVKCKYLAHKLETIISMFVCFLIGRRIIGLVDRRFSGVVKGVGQGRIVGRVHSAPIQIGDIDLPNTSFLVIHTGNHQVNAQPLINPAAPWAPTIPKENPDLPDLLLGLDVLRRYRMCIDLDKMALVVQGIAIPFVNPLMFQKTNLL